MHEHECMTGMGSHDDEPFQLLAAFAGKQTDHMRAYTLDYSTLHYTGGMSAWH